MKKVNSILILPMLGLLLFSIFFVYSSSVDASGSLESSQFIRQLVFIIMGLVLFIGLQFVSIQTLKEHSVLIYAVLIALMVLTLLFGEAINGAKSWLRFFGFGIQISEFMKIGVIILLSTLLETHKPDLRSCTNTLLYAFIVLVPVGLILLQPDMGTALVYIPILLSILYIAGVPLFRIVFVIGIGVVSVLTLIVLYYIQSTLFENTGSLEIIITNSFYLYVGMLLLIFILSLLGYYIRYIKRFFKVCLYISTLFTFGTILAMLAIKILKPYQMQRILVFVNPVSDPLGSGWHILQSVAAIGSGGFGGQGFLQGSLSKLKFLPQKSTDFIFSVLGEEAGFLGSMSVVILYTILVWHILIIGRRVKDMFSKYFCVGVAAMFFTHFVVNIGMTIGIIPVTGIPLMLLSYGGSSIWTALISLGIIHNIYYNEYYTKKDVIVSF